MPGLHCRQQTRNLHRHSTGGASALPVLMRSKTKRSSRSKGKMLAFVKAKAQERLICTHARRGRNALHDAQDGAGRTKRTRAEGIAQKHKKAAIGQIWRPIPMSFWGVAAAWMGDTMASFIHAATTMKSSPKVPFLSPFLLASGAASMPAAARG